MAIIRLATRKDVGIIKTYRDKASSETPYVNTLSATNLKALFDAIANTNGEFYYIALDQDRVIGQVIFKIDNILGKIYLKNISILKGYYGTNVATELIEIVELAGIKENAMTVELIVDKNNKRAVMFYEKQGYIFIEKWKKGSSNHIYSKNLSKRTTPNALMDNQT
jgi:ribosomal protein S18 acetylase RimI-like enzyme